MAQVAFFSTMTKSNENNKFIMYETLIHLCTNNEDFFHHDDSENGQRLYEGFRALKEHVNVILPLVQDISEIAPSYDFDASVPGNGFRSFLTVVDSAVIHGVTLGRKICIKRDNILFRKGLFVREIEACSHLFASLIMCLQRLQLIADYCTPGDLFSNENHGAIDLLTYGFEINQYCFYGRCLGFQFCESMRNALKFISVCMAGFSEVYYNRGSIFSKATSSVWLSGKYLMDPELRARRIVNISQHAGVGFCKSFWLLAENDIMQRIPSIVSHSVAVNKVITIPPEPLQYEKWTDTFVDIPIPESHIGPGPIQVRLISSVAREGMVGAVSSSKIQPKSKGLIIHCHGGGFVAQSSRSHEMYLRHWAVKTDVPILSIDYSLSPEAPYPRASEEVLYSYIWALNNCEMLGTTAEQIVFAGDSAGANLVLGLAIRCLEMDLRKPDGVFLVYVPVVVNYVASPARLLSIMDPLIPLGFLIRCLKAYCCPPDQNKKSESDGNFERKESKGADNSSPEMESFEEVSESDLAELQAHKSPGSELSDTLTSVSLSSQPSAKYNTFVHVNNSNDIPRDPSDINIELNQKYVSEFDTFVNELELGQDVIQDLEQTEKRGLSKFMNSITDTFTKWASSVNFSGPSDAEIALDMDEDNLKNLKEEFGFKVPDDPYLSPYYTKNELLEHLPPVRILTVEMDPCLDDCVMFAKKIKSLNRDVQLTILEGLPHGFLNFCLLSKEAYEGTEKCATILKELLKPPPDFN